MGGGGSKFGTGSSAYSISGTVYKANFKEFRQANAGNVEMQEYYKKNHSLLPLYNQAQQVRFQELQRQEVDREPLSREEAERIVREVERDARSEYQRILNQGGSRQEGSRGAGQRPSLAASLYKRLMEGENALHASWSLAYRNYADGMHQQGKTPVSYKAWLNSSSGRTSTRSNGAGTKTRRKRRASGGGVGGGGMGGGGSRNKKGSKNSKNKDGYGYFGNIDELIRQKK